MLHSPHTLPANLPVPEDDGAARHLVGARVAGLTLSSTCGELRRLPELLAEPTVLFFYPRTGVPGQPPNLSFSGEDWDDIPGARGCTPQSCGFRDLYGEFQALGVRVYGVSTQSTEFQQEFKERNHVPFDFLSDADLSLTRAMALPTFEFPVESGGPNTLIKRMSWFVHAGRIEHVWYPVFPPNENADRVLAWLREQVGFFRGVEHDGLVYRRERDVGVDELSRVFASSGIGRPHDAPERLGRMLANSNLVLTVRDQGRLVGVARCLTDHAWCCYVSDLAVDRDYQRRGLGKRLLEMTKQIVGPECVVLLVAAPSAESYYPRIGMEAVPSTWRWPRIR